MNNTGIGIISALFILIGSWVLSLTNFCGWSAEAPINFSFTDGAFKTKNVTAFSFEKDGIFATIPAATNGELKKIAAHFKSNENRTLSLIGNYYASEKYSGETNLGKERAEAIKAKLEKYGTPGDRIFTSGNELTEKLEGKRLYNAVVFEGNEKVVEDAPPLKTEKPFSVLDPFTVRFGPDGDKPEMTDELRNYLDLALAYLDKNPRKKLMVTGYTDNQDSSKSNLKLSKKKAQIVRRLLRDVGQVPSEKVGYTGKGGANEIASNNTEEGRALNRRVEITIE